MRNLLLFFSFILLAFHLVAQQTNSASLVDAFNEAEQKWNVKIYFLEEFLPDKKVVISTNTSDVKSYLDSLLKNTNLGYIDYHGYSFMVAPRKRIEREYDNTYFSERAQRIISVNSEKNNELKVYSVGNINNRSQGNTAVSGFITDDASEESLIGTTIFFEELNIGVVTDEIGRYKVELPPGQHTVRISSIGYLEKKFLISVLGSGELDVTLSKEAIQLGEVVVTSERQNENITRGNIGLETLEAGEIKKLPSFLGEADVMKSLLLLPGVSSVGEGSGGINVRGGTVDQNLIMQDGLYLFNSSHVLGLFSLFNADVVKNVNLYKGSMPPRFGGRLSSALEVELKEGNYQQFTGTGGIGLVSSRLLLETPVKKGTSSLLIGTRFSFSDYIFRVIDVADLSESSASFYDSNIKYTHRIKNKGKLSVGGYISNDRFKYSREFDFTWKTLGVNSQFNYVFSNFLSMRLEGVYSQYKSNWDEPATNRAFELENGINYFKVRGELNYNPTSGFRTNAGIEINSYKVNPGEIYPITDQSVTIPAKVPLEYGREISFYLNEEVELESSLLLSIGARYTIYQSLGQAEVTKYEPGAPRNTGTVVGSESFNDGEVIQTYTGIEPRASLKWELNQSSSVKLSYSRTRQYLNQISNTTAVSPVDIWQLSNSHIQPVTADNYSIGFFKNLQDNLWETSIEFFYRDIENLIEYKDLADLLVNDHIETELIQGEGRIYGAELSVKKTAGRFTGRLGYTYSRTERRTQSQFLEETINNNQWFLANFDRPQDVSLIFTYQANRRNHLAVNFVYSSGRPVTAPVGSFSSDNIFNIAVYSDRNSFRIPAYHRLDVSYTIGKGHRKNKSFKSSWTFSIFNVYGRRNPFSVYFTQQPFQNPQANRLAVLGSMIPSINYNFSF